MKFTEEGFETVSQLLEEAHNSCEDEKRREELENAMNEIDAIGTY